MKRTLTIVLAAAVSGGVAGVLIGLGLGEARMSAALGCAGLSTGQPQGPAKRGGSPNALRPSAGTPVVPG